MPYLWDTTGSIVSGVGFRQFDLTHCLWLLFGALFIFGLCAFCRRLGEKGQLRMKRIIALAVVADEAFKFAVLLIGGHFTVNYLPFHLCSINVFIVAWHAVRPNRALDNFLYAVCIPAALMALFFPNWTKLPAQNLMHIHSFTFHILLVAYPAMLLSTGKIRPRVKYIPQCVGLLAALACIAAVVNRLLGTNFMFLRYAGKGNPLLWFEKNMGHHLWGYAVLVPAVLLAMYAPELLHLASGHRRRMRRVAH